VRQKSLVVVFDAKGFLNNGMSDIGVRNGFVPAQHVEEHKNCFHQVMVVVRKQWFCMAKVGNLTTVEIDFW